MLKDETFFDSVLFLPCGRIAIRSSAVSRCGFLSKNKARTNSE